MHKYTVEGYTGTDTSEGFAIDIGYDTLKQAKAKARYILTQEYANVCESSPLALAVIRNKAGEIVEEYSA